MKYCKYCGNKLEENMDVCLNCGKIIKEDRKTNQNKPTSSNNMVPKSKIGAGLLGIFLGCFGVHNFYLGYNGKAVAQLLITVLSCGIFSFISGIWGLIEGILILCGTINQDAFGNELGD